MLDVSATLEERATEAPLVAFERYSLLTVGGGVQSVEDARRLLNAVRQSQQQRCGDQPRAGGALQSLGRQCTVVAVDAGSVRKRLEVVTRSGTCATGLDVVDWLAQVEELGAGDSLDELGP